MPARPPCVLCIPVDALTSNTHWQPPFSKIKHCAYWQPPSLHLWNPKKHHLFVPDNQHTDVIIGEMFLKKRGCFFCSLPSISGKTFTEKTGVFPSPPGSPRDGCNDQSGPMGPILLSAVLAASKAMRQQAGGKWGNGVALEKGGERCFRKVFWTNKKGERFQEALKPVIFCWTRWDRFFCFKVSWLHH